MLALQGDVREHLHVLDVLGVTSLAVRRESELAACDALILPGGESTTMAKLARIFEIFESVRQRIAEGMPAFGTCAGMILLANEIQGGTADQETFGGLDITVRRNAFGRQVDSFEGDIEVTGFTEPVHAVFIRAPWVERVSPSVEVLARIPGAVNDTDASGRIVAVRQDQLMATSFHPEVGGDPRLHGLFVELVRQT